MTFIYSKANKNNFFSDIPSSFIDSNLRSKASLRPSTLTRLASEEDKSKIAHGNTMRSSVSDDPIYVIYEKPIKAAQNEEGVKKQRKSLWRVPTSSRLRKVWWLYTWPIKFLLFFLIPDPKTYRRCYPLTFFMCVIIIGLNSFLIVFMVTIIGKKFFLS